ncbi:tetratricopeptide repeat protein [Shimazuella sp. AN120528]|uniref:helix-turn-helix domain-containing protein n=1 Tax=Shimazuella soli TaxID=1892854 RepID=UPI001F0DB7F1|nr:tetratricopeptide repeat protein [Shimazuella soli]MCH5584913.1 tetratricopeptide repeat protein [Shimazuella soli]
MKATVFVSYEQGEKIRRARRKRQITQEDLALSLDISPSLVSKIERGTYQVAEDNLVAICDYLELEVGEILEEKKEDGNEQVDIRLLLKTIEHDIHLVGADEAWQELQKIKLEPDDPMLGDYYYLQGKLYEINRNLVKALEFYGKAIRYVDQFPNLKNTNVKTVSYHGISRIYERQNHLDQALEAVELGGKFFVETDDRSYVKYNLLLSKSIYLEKLNQNEDAFRITKQLQENRTKLASSEAKTNLSQLQATLYNKFGLYDQAIYHTEEGLLLARLDKQYDRSLELWTTKGESYRKKGEYSNAKHCLRTALKLKDKINHSPLAIDTYTQLGLLYLELNDLQKSLETLKQAVKLGEETSDNVRLMNALIASGDCYLHQEQMNKAHHQYENALAIAKTHSYNQHEWDILMKLAATCKQSKPDHYLEYVEQFHQLSLKLWKGGKKKMTFNERLNVFKLHLDAEPPMD